MLREYIKLLMVIHYHIIRIVYIYVIFKFNETYTQIEYIQVYPYLYSINRHIINDDDFYIIKFANILYDNYSIIT